MVDAFGVSCGSTEPILWSVRQIWIKPLFQSRLESEQWQGPRSALIVTLGDMEKLAGLCNKLMILTLSFLALSLSTFPHLPIHNQHSFLLFIFSHSFSHHLSFLPFILHSPDTLSCSLSAWLVPHSFPLNPHPPTYLSPSITSLSLPPYDRQVRQPLPGK